MRKVIFTLCLLVSGGMLFAQKIKVEEKKEKIGGGSNNALVVNIYEADEETILKEWKSKMRDYNAKVSTKDGELFADNAVIKSMLGNNTIDVYARVEKGKDGEMKFIVGFDLGGAFLNSSQHSKEYSEAKRIVQEFAEKTTRDAIDGMLKDAEKALKKMENEQESLVKKNKDYKSDIENYKEKIKKAEEEIKKNEEEQKKKNAEIEGQKKVVDGIKKKKDAAK